MSLLPPNSTAAERAIEDAMMARIDLSTLHIFKSAQDCPAEMLPFLAAELEVSHWDATWTEAEKRAAIVGATAFHKRKGTRKAVEEVLARFHPALAVKEWHETSPARLPHTFEVRAPASDIPASFLTVETAEAIIADVAAVKPLRAHFDFVQSLESRLAVYLGASGMTGSMTRADYLADHDTSRDWNLVLQTEDGEPIRMEAGADYLENA